MNRMIVGAALIAALGASPVIAKDKALKDQGAQKSSSISQEDQNRFQNPDGTFQGKPVVQGPANWKSAASGSGSGSASTGASSGESGSGMEQK